MLEPRPDHCIVLCRWASHFAQLAPVESTRTERKVSTVSASLFVADVSQALVSCPGRGESVQDSHLLNSTENWRQSPALI